MRMVKTCMAIAFLALAMIPCLAYGQTDPVMPPRCCNLDDPSGGDSVILGGSMDATGQISISDATLGSAGLSRSQFLKLLAGTLFPNAGQAVSLIIPVINPGTASPVSAQDPSVINYQFAIGQVSARLLNALTWLYVTDGKTKVVVIFTKASTGSGH